MVTCDDMSKTIFWVFFHWLRHGARLIDGMCMKCGNHRGPRQRRFYSASGTFADKLANVARNGTPAQMREYLHEASVELKARDL